MSPLSQLRETLESRTGLGASMHRAADVAMPGGARWRHVFGLALVALFVVEALTIVDPRLTTALIAAIATRRRLDLRS